MTSRWLQAQLTLAINVLTLKTEDISSPFLLQCFITFTSEECLK